MGYIRKGAYAPFRAFLDTVLPKRGEKLLIQNTTDCSGVNTGALQVAGGGYIAKRLLVSGKIETTNTGADSIKTAGGGQFAGAVKVGAYTLPATDGTVGQVLVTNGLGVVIWQDESGGSGGSVDPEVNALGAIDGAMEIDLSDGVYVTGTLTGAITISFASAGRPASGYVRDFTLRFSGNEDITYPAGTKFSGSIEPVIVGTEYQIEGMIDSSGNVTIYGVIDNIGTV